MKIIKVSTGIKALDEKIGGWQKSDLVILAARPGMGKTSFILSIARNAALDFKKPVALFSLEMSATQLHIVYFPWNPESLPSAFPKGIWMKPSGFD